MSVSGKKLAAAINGTAVVGLVSWRLSETSQELDATTGADLGFESPDHGLLGCQVELGGTMDLTTGRYVPLRAGTTLANLRLFREVTDVTPAALIPTALILQSNQGGEVRGRFEIAATIKSKGSYTISDPA